MKPAAFTFCEVAFDERKSLRGAEVHVGGFPTHVVQEADFVAIDGERSEFDAGTIRGQAADHPTFVKADERIGNTETKRSEFRAVE